MICFSHVLTFIIFLMVGLFLGKRTFKYTSKSHDYTFIILTILSTTMGINTYLFKFFNFEVNLSTVLTATFLGIVIRRFNKKHTLIQKLN